MSLVLNPTELGGRLTSDGFLSALRQFEMECHRDARNGGRRDSHSGDIISTREHLNGVRLDSVIRSPLMGDRADSFSQNAGFHHARQLEFIHAEVLEEEFPVPNALRVFTTDESVPVGARTHTMRRRFLHGEARVYRGGGDEIPRVGSTQREETWPIRHIVAGYGWNIFEAQSETFANSGKMRTDARNARDVIMNLANRLWWTGSEQHDLYGVLTYPFLPKKTIATSFTRASMQSDPDAILGELHDLVNFPHDNSQSTFQPTRLLLTNKVHDRLSSVRFAAGSDTTILQHFLANSAHITGVDVVWELEDAGGTDVHGMFAYRNDQRGVQLVMPQGVTQLPVQMQGLESLVINYMSLGGVVMPDVLNNILGFVNV